MKIAFSLEDYYEPRMLKNDPKYVKWVFRQTTRVAGETFVKTLPFHKCSDEEYAEFYPTERIYELKLQAIRKDPNRGFYCIDWDTTDQKSEIWGTEQADDYQRFDLMITPCNYINSDSETTDTVSDECITDINAQKAYMDQSQWILLVNQERFNPEKFNDESIERYSTFITNQFNNNVPNW